MVMEMEEDSRIPIILERSFLATVGAMVNVKNDRLAFKVGNEKVAFYLPQSMANPYLDDICYIVDVLENVLSKEAITYHSVEDPLEAVLVGYNVTALQSR